MSTIAIIGMIKQSSESLQTQNELLQKALADAMLELGKPARALVAHQVAEHIKDVKS